MVERSDRRRIAKIEKDWKNQLVVKKEQIKCYGHYNCQMMKVISEVERSEKVIYQRDLGFK
ncbi:MAG: hypothetical protein H7647_03695 [Candidatus Heimdallarchaeota archaeon]|nr:hypothetical protein [Candidatus Heimdallarchaeota archaeon]MCK4253531.1 hypothetical protein [Candidatus Heimdallarchaeota archaeon]